MKKIEILFYRKIVDNPLTRRIEVQKQTKWQPHQLPIIPVLLLLLLLPPHNLELRGIQHLRLLVGRCTCNAHQHQTTSLRPHLRSLPLPLPSPSHTFLFTELLPHHPAHNLHPSGVKTIPPRVVGFTHRVFMTRTAMMNSQTSPPFAYPTTKKKKKTSSVLLLQTTHTPVPIVVSCLRLHPRPRFCSKTRRHSQNPPHKLPANPATKNDTKK